MNFTKAYHNLVRAGCDPSRLNGGFKGKSQDRFAYRTEFVDGCWFSLWFDKLHQVWLVTKRPTAEPVIRGEVVIRTESIAKAITVYRLAGGLL